MRNRYVAALALLLGAALALGVGTRGSDGTRPARAETRGAGFGTQTPPASVRKKLRELEGGLARLSREISAGRVRPESRTLRVRIADLLTLRAEVAAELPKTLGIPFPSLNGHLAGLESTLDRATESAAFSSTSARVRTALLRARTETRELERELRPARAPNAARNLLILTRKLDGLIARLRDSKKTPGTIGRDLWELAQLASGLAQALPRTTP